MEKITNTIAEKISSELDFDNDHKEIIAYGIFAVLQTLFSIGVTVIFGIIWGVLAETLIVAFTISILRKYSGGVHASSPEVCAVIGGIVAAGLALLACIITVSLINLKFSIILGFPVFTWAVYIMYKLSPVDSAAKPIKSEKKKKKMKKASILILCAYALIVILNIIIYLNTHERRFLAYSLCIYGGIMWQSFTLTYGGHIIIQGIDTFLHKILYYRGREK